MNWKKSDIPLILNGFCVGMLFWVGNMKHINLLHVLYFAGAYLTIIAYGEFVKNEK
jgi:hypothetical protein